MLVVLKELMKKTTDSQWESIHEAPGTIQLVPNLYVAIQEYYVKSPVYRSFQYYTDFIKAIMIYASWGPGYVWIF